MDRSHGLIVIDNSDKASKPLPNDCPLCSYAILSSNDVEALRKFDCCSACALRWAEGRRQAWFDGWRPSATEFREYLEARSLILFPVPRFKGSHT
jgi:hypothetical protein